MHVKTAAIGLVCASLLIALAPPSLAPGGRPLDADLSGDNEVPPADPDGTGHAFVRVNPGLGEVCWELTVENIEPATAAHIHRAPAGVNGPVVVPLSPPTDGSSSGCADVDKDLAKEIVKQPSEFYVNVHNEPFPGGAVRGQLEPVEDDA